MTSLGVYIQIPFCASKCAFCNFSSKVAPVGALQTYLGSLEREFDLLDRLSDRGAGREGRVAGGFLGLPADSIYLGGGTPTLAGRDGLARVFARLRRRFALANALEVTLEMTPASADTPLLAACRALGINRLSIGAQSFDDRELRSVGRLHSGAETEEQVRRARKEGFGNISLDLIAGLPYQTEASWLGSLQRTLDLAPEHVSVYLFEIDEKSRLGHEVLRHGERYHALEVPGEDFLADAYGQAQDSLAGAGYLQYEISNFARPGFESRHNRKYWRLEPYLGLGAGAHSFDGQSRWANETSTAEYAARLALGELPIAEWRPVREAEQVEEFFFLGLRQRDGVDLGGLTSRWGRAAVERWRPRIRSLVRDGWLEERGERLYLAPRAYLVSNEVFQEFLA
ncbi:MAG TPA: radical SAM family heme chaperone HemW [Terriglobia bacterium]|nr:radical SAM family heme chaperone HemW [Terriglobia bacterium]